MSASEHNYLLLLEEVLEQGEVRDDRTGVGTKSIFGTQTRYDLRKGFPLLTTKKVHWPSIVHELIWFLSGSTNIAYLQKHNVRIWDEWADEKGELGPVYGKQWRAWNAFAPLVQGPTDIKTLEEKGISVPEEMLDPNEKYWTRLDVMYQIDQISQVIEQIRNNPMSRRIIVSAWNPAEIPEMKLPPCHAFFQFYCHTDGGLSLQLYQRSADMFLGVPFNIASYSLLLMMVAQVTGRTPREFIHTMGDTHIYENHIEQVNLQLSREPRALPNVKLNEDIDSIFKFTFEDITLENYNPHPLIKGKVAV